MYSRKSTRPRMGPWRTPALWYYYEDWYYYSYLEPLEAVYYWEKKK